MHLRRAGVEEHQGREEAKKMRRLIALVCATICAGTVLAQATKIANVRPESFELVYAQTTQGIETLFQLDSQGMYLESTVDGPTGPNGEYELAIEVTGSVQSRPLAHVFGVSETSYSGSTVVTRVEMYNYATNSWKPVATQVGQASGSSANGRPFIAPMTYAQVN